MNAFAAPQTQRRQFLQHAGRLAAGVLGASLLRSEETPINANPRAIAGDSVEPDWRERLTITVGPGQSDFAGTTDRVIQAAIDYVARLGGGTVRILPGTYRLRNSVFLQSRVRLQGSGADSVLVKEPSVATKLTVDGDHWDQEVTLADPGGFQIGDGVRLVAKDPFSQATNIIQRTLVAASGNRFKLDRRLEQRFHLVSEPAIATNFALLQGTNVADVVVEHLTVDGNKKRNQMVDRGKFDDGSIRLDGCNRITVREVTVRDAYCDGIVWGISHDVRVEQCVLHDAARFGLHPGSGSQRSILRGNRILRSQQGVYFCWGAQHGLVEKNAIEDCSYGMTIGHRDSDNLIRDNDVRRSGLAGIHFRPVASDNKAFAAHRNRLERNRISDSGPANGVAIDIAAGAEGVTVAGNELRETRKPLARTGIRIGTGTSNIRCLDNRIEGFAAEISDLSKSKL